MKLWFFRTPKGMCVLSPCDVTYDYMIAWDTWGDRFSRHDTIQFGRRRPAGCPKLAKGSCVPVTLRAEG